MTAAASDSTARLLAMFSDQLVPASELAPGRMVAFKRLANQYGSFLVGPDKDRWERFSGPVEGSPESAVELYRDATEEQRQAIDAVMQRHPNYHAYSALMKALLSEHNETNQGVFDLLVLFYDDISAIAGTEGEANAYKTVAALGPITATARGLNSYGAVLGVTMLCLYNRTESPALVNYLTDDHTPRTAALPAVHTEHGNMWTLRPEHAEMVKDHTLDVQTITAAMKRSARAIGADELELVLAGDQPVPLVEGLL